MMQSSTAHYQVSLHFREQMVCHANYSQSQRNRTSQRNHKKLFFLQHPVWDFTKGQPVIPHLAFAVIVSELESFQLCGCVCQTQDGCCRSTKETAAGCRIFPVLLSSGQRSSNYLSYFRTVGFNLLTDFSDLTQSVAFIFARICLLWNV